MADDIAKEAARGCERQREWDWSKGGPPQKWTAELVIQARKRIAEWHAEISWILRYGYASGEGELLLNARIDELRRAIARVRKELESAGMNESHLQVIRSELLELADEQLAEVRELVVRMRKETRAE